MMVVAAWKAAGRYALWMDAAQYTIDSTSEQNRLRESSELDFPSKGSTCSIVEIHSGFFLGANYLINFVEKNSIFEMNNIF